MEDLAEATTELFTLEDIEAIPTSARKKIKKLITDLKNFEMIQDAKVVAETRLKDYIEQVENMRATKQDLVVKLQNSEESTNELRRQLDQVSKERNELLNKTNNYEREISSMRRQQNDIIDERDALANRGERLMQRVDTLQQEYKELDSLFKNAVQAKCEALVRADEVESKETALALREKNLEREREFLNARIQSMADEVHTLQYEITNSRREFNSQILSLQSRLSDKTQELSSAQRECSQYQKQNEELNETLHELTEKIRSEKDEFAKMAESYLKELEAKDKLIEMLNKDIQMDTNSQNELVAVIEKHKKIIVDQSKEFDEKETELKALYLKYEQDMEEKDKQIAILKEELKNMNDALKKAEGDNLESTIAKIAPTAAVTCHAIRFNMTLTELYTAYVKTKEELNQQKHQHAQLKIDFDAVMNECKEKYPEAEKQRQEYERLVENFKILEDYSDKLKTTLNENESKMQSVAGDVKRLESQMKRKEFTIIDLNRQICYLLKENQYLRTGECDEEAALRESALKVANSANGIPSTLVAFNSIQELMERNMQLLSMVRKLTEQTEEYEKLKIEFDSASYQQKLETYEKHFKNLQDNINKKNELIATYVRRCEYFKTILATNRKVKEFDFDSEERADEACTVKKTSNVREPPSSKRRRKGSDGENEDDENVGDSITELKNTAAQILRVQQLEQQLEAMNEKCKALKEQHEYYVKEKSNNDKIMLEEADAKRAEIRELTTSNSRLLAEISFYKSQAQIQLKNIEGFKKQIEIIEERYKQNEKILVKYEHNVTVMHEEINKAHRKEAELDFEVKNVRQENSLLKQSVAQLKAEREGVLSTMHSQKILENNLEMIKNSIERSDTEGRERAERRLDDSLRECAALRRSLKEKEETLEEMVKNIKAEKEKAMQRLQSEQQQVEKLHSELSSTREDVKAKAKEIDDLGKKLQETLSPQRRDNPVTIANKRARDLELKLQKADSEIEVLRAELQSSQETTEEYQRISSSVENNLKELTDKYNLDVNKLHLQMKELEARELDYKSKISELEAEVQLSNITETTISPENNSNAENIKKLQQDLSVALQNLTASQKEIRKLRSQNASLEESFNSTSAKLISEMNSHSNDLQELANIKNTYNKLQNQINDLVAERDEAKAEYKKLENSHGDEYKTLLKQHEELNKRCDELSEVNANLYHQVESLSERLAFLAHTQNTTIGTNNDSVMDTSTTSESATPTGVTSELNRSQTDATALSANHEELFKIIKFLRKEKDILISKFDIMNVEKARLISEQKILQKEVDNLKNELEKERTVDEGRLFSSKKHEEMLEKLDDIKSLKDSNRLIREERDAMALRLSELNKRISELEEELYPLKNKQRDLNVKIDDLTAENSSLRTEAMKWRQRANILVEKSNKNPEEFKRLQAERENLAKMLTTEKDAARKVSDELNAMRADKIRLETETKAIQRQLQAITEENDREKKKVSDEYATQKQNNGRLLQEVMEVRSKLLQKEDEVQQMQRDLEGKENLVLDLKTKEVQLRKIAKRYKDQCLELQNKLAARSAGEPEESSGAVIGTGSGGDQMETSDATGAGTSTTSSDLLQHRNEIERLNTEIRTIQEEYERLNRDHDTLRASSDEQLQKLREAKTHIASITESKAALAQELTTVKSKLQNTATQDALNRAQSEEALVRLTRENEQLNLRIMQLNRQLGLQQSAKPSTSSVAMAEKGGHLESPSLRTANVKPMSGSGGSMQQSATVTPWRGSETAFVRPISVQNSRTAAILPTSQQTSSAGSSSSTTSGGSSTTSSSTSPSVGTPTSAGCSNTALVPPQQVHTTGNSSVESMSMSSSPTSSHTDYMPSTSSAAVAVAAIPPMGSTSSSASVAESSQEAESVQQQQQQQPNESSQLLISGGQQQVVALVSPRVEGSSSSSQTTSSPNLQLQPDPNNQQQQPSTSGTTSGSTSHIASVSSHNRHTQPSSSNVTTSQAGKRAREHDGDSSTSAEESGSEKHPGMPTKRLRTPMHGAEATTAIVAGITADADNEYQVPTSSQRDQEDDVVLIDSEADEEDDGMAEADDGPADGEQESYEDSYEQDMSENDPEVNESRMRVDEVDEEDEEADNVDEEDVDDDNEVDIEEGNQAQCSSAGIAISAADAEQRQQSTDNQPQQQSQAISSGSGGNYSDAASVSTHGEQNVRAAGNVDAGECRKEGDAQNIAERNDSARTEQDNTDNNNPGCSNQKDDQKDTQGSSTSSAAAALAEREEAEAEYEEDQAVVPEENVENASQSEMLPEHDQEDNEENADGVTSEGEKQQAVGGNDLSVIQEEGREAEASTTASIKTRSRVSRNTPSPRRNARSNFPRNNRNITWQSDIQQMQSPNAGRGYGMNRVPRATRARARRPSNTYSAHF